MDFIRSSAYRTQDQGERLVKLGRSCKCNSLSKLDQEYRAFLIVAGNQLQTKAQTILMWDQVIGDDWDSALANTAAITGMLQTVRLTLETREILLKATALFLSSQSHLSRDQEIGGFTLSFRL